MKLLLLSNSTIKGEPYLNWPNPYLIEFLKDINELLFVPYAGITMSYDTYTSNVSNALEKTGTQVTGIHTVKNKLDAVNNAEAIAVGGGNTFHLLHKLQQENLLEPIRHAVKKGMPYIGWSAGSNVACPTIMTTNDMPIIQPASFEALSLTSFQINAHYTEKTLEGHGGESRNMRINELLEVNKKMEVVGLPEGKLLECNGNKWYLKGIESEPTYYFKAGIPPQELKPGLISQLI